MRCVQKAVFKHFPELQKFALTNVASIDTRESLLKHFQPLTYEMLPLSLSLSLCMYVCHSVCLFNTRESLLKHFQPLTYEMLFLSVCLPVCLFT